MPFALGLLLATACAEPADDAGAEGVGDVAGTSSTSSDETSGSDDAASNGGPSVTESLVDAEAWQLDPMVPPALDSDRPAEVVCEFGYGLEDGLFEVDTELCNWGAFSQPTLVPIAAGDAVEVIVLHDTLYSEDEGATAHLAVAVGETMVWDATIAIPAPPGFLRPTITAEQDWPVGTPLHLHVHNHGYNNYRIVDITVTH